jgi:hypothetical protein
MGLAPCHTARRGWRPLVVAQLCAALVLAQLAVALPPATAQSTGERMEAAQDRFFEGRFEAARAELDAMLAGSDLTPEERVEAFALKARCEMELGDRTSAVDAFCELLEIDRDWRPDPVFYTSFELQVFQDARDSCRPETREAPAESALETPAGTVPPEAGEPDGAAGVEEPDQPVDTRTGATVPATRRTTKEGAWYTSATTWLIAGAVAAAGVAVALVSGSSGDGDGDDGGNGGSTIPDYPPPPQ